MSELLLVQIDFNSKTWYLSQEGFIGDHYYAPYLESSPEIEIGQTKGGFINVRIGELTIANRPNERVSPFSIFGGGYELLINNPTSKIPVRIYWRQNDVTESIFEGTMYLQSFDVDKFDFILEDSFEDVDLLTSVSDIKSDFSEMTSVSIRGLGTVSGTPLAEVLAPDHGLVAGDFVNISNASTAALNTPASSTIGEKREITFIDENVFRYQTDTSTTAYEISGSYDIKFLTKKNNPFSFGIVNREKGLIQTEDGTNGSSGFAYANPQLKLPTDYASASDIVYIKLFDDGVLVGSGDPTSTKRTISPVVGTGGISVAHDIVTITTQSAHNLTSGSVIRITGLSPDGFNVPNLGIPIIDTPTSTTFTYFNNTAIDSGTTTQVNAGAEIKFEGEYFGAVRTPTADKISSRQTVNTLTSGQTQSSEDGSVTYEATDGVVLLGTALVSGESKNGSTLSDFFSFIASKLSITNVDFKNSPNADTLKLQLWETSQTKVIDYAGEISLSANHLFEIKNNILRVIDREFVPDEFIFIENFNIISASYKMPLPIKAFRSEWKQNTVNGTQIPAVLEEKQESVMITNLPTGEIRDIRYITKSIEDQRSMLKKIKEITNKIVVTSVIGNVLTNIKVGSRVKFNREEDGVSVDMIVRIITYDFQELQTQIVGDGTVGVISQDAIY